MGSAGADEPESHMDMPEALREPNKRLQLAAVLLVIAAILGFATVAASAISSSEMAGLGELFKEAKADVMGQVKDGEGDPIQGAVVTFSKTGSSYITGASGWYFLEGLPTGEVSLRMEADGYQTVVREVTLERGQYVVDFVTSPGSGEVVDTDEAVPEAGDPEAGTVLLLVVITFASILAILGAWAAYSHSGYLLAMAGALFGLLTIGWFVGTACALVALLLVVPLREEFRGRPQVPQVPWRAWTEPARDQRREREAPVDDEGGDRTTDGPTTPPERGR